ncbi:hypothetical protein GCM10022225_43970 [Plantactinospora mayteni]|uniref:Bacterial transcriptional activator domain-containing protein n=1 Tax=Plantactinospora mayteni TaxID=566021 RepID=A0ABQ4ERV4_9ACTN|nr:hypothetical protein [Plantactinospora mayteni]GIG97393.1 hypothetical protein Pma05_39660 [Plantactinospora mayteni]
MRRVPRRLDEALATFERSVALAPDVDSIGNIFQLLEVHGVPEPFVDFYTRLRTAIGDPGFTRTASADVPVPDPDPVLSPTLS